MSKQPSDTTKGLVWQRAAGSCERCGAPVHAGFYSYHHRRVKGMGGDKREDTNLPANLLLLCGSGTTGCHGYVHSGTGAQEARAGGWLISRWSDPQEEIVRLALYGLALLDNDGGLSAQAVDSPACLPPDHRPPDF